MQTRFTPNESIVSADLDNEIVLLNVETGVYFGLDPVGSRIWTLVGEGASEEAIFATLSAEYEVAPDRLREDLSGFLALLLEKGLTRAGDA